MPEGRLQGEAILFQGFQQSVPFIDEFLYH